MDKKKKIRIADYLKKRKENAITTPELLKLTGFHSARTLQSAIAKERQETVICSGLGRSYWLPIGKEDIEEFNNNMTSGVIRIFESSKCVVEELGIVTGQVEIFGGISGGENVT